MMYVTEIIDTFEEFRRLEPEWNDAVARSDFNLPFATFEWFSSWWQAYGERNSLLVAVARRNGELAAIAPFMGTTERLMGLPARVITFMDNYQTARNGLIVARGHGEAVGHLFERLARVPYRYDFIRLHSMEKESPSDLLVRSALLSRNARFLELEGKYSPYIPVRGSWQGYFEKIPKKTRQRLGHFEKLISRRGGEVRRYTRDGIPRAMEEVLSVSKRTWKFREGTAIASTARQTRFYRLLAEAFSRKGRLELWVLKLDGDPAAFQFNLRYDDVLYGLKIGFAEEYRQVSPSRHLAVQVIRHCFESGVREFDLMGESEPHKSDWTEAGREHCKYLCFNATPYGRLLHALETRVAPGVKRLLAGRR